MTDMTVTWICLAVVLIGLAGLIGLTIHTYIVRGRRWADFEDLIEAVKEGNETEAQRIEALYLEDVEFCECVKFYKDFASLLE